MYCVLEKLLVCWLVGSVTPSILANGLQYAVVSINYFTPTDPLRRHFESLHPPGNRKHLLFGLLGQDLSMRQKKWPVFRMLTPPTINANFAGVRHATIQQNSGRHTTKIGQSPPGDRKDKTDIYHEMGQQLMVK